MKFISSLMMKTHRPLASRYSLLLWPALACLAAPLAQAGDEPQFRILKGAAAAGGGPNVKRFDFSAPRVPFYPRAYPQDLRGGTQDLAGASIAIDEQGVHLAIGDLDGDGRAELVTCTTLKGAPGGGPHIRIYSQPVRGGASPSLTDPHTQFPVPGEAASSPPCCLAVGHFSNGAARIVIAAGVGGGPHVKLLTPAGDLVSEFAPYGAAYNGGIRIATGDVTGDGIDDIITAAGAGGGPHVKVFSGADNGELYDFEPFPTAPAGGVHVAAGDLDGDGRAEVIVCAGAGGGPHVKVFSGAGFGPGTVPPEVSYIPFGGRPLGGTRVAAGDVNGDGRADLVVAGVVNGRRRVEVLKSNKTGDPNANREIWTWGDEPATQADQYGITAGDLDGDGMVEIGIGGQVPRALIWSPRSNVTMDFDAYPPAFTGGVRVASGDVNGDGVEDIITATGAGGGPHVKVFDGTNGAPLLSFFAFDPAFLGGVSIATGDVTGDGAADIIAGSGAGGAPHVKVFDGRTGAEIRSFFAYPAAFTGGVNVGGGDLDGDGKAEIITGSGAGGGPHVKVFDGATGAERLSFFAFDLGYTGGVNVCAHLGVGMLPSVPRHIGVSRMAGAGAGGGPHVKVFDGNSGAELGAFAPFGEDFAGGVTVASGDVDGDGVAELLAAASPLTGGPVVVGLDLVTRAIEFRASLGPASADPPGEAPFIAVGSRPLPVLAIQPPKLVGTDLYVSVTGTPGTWLNFETCDDMLNWLPASSTFIPDSDHILIGQTTPVVQGTRHYVRAAAK